LTLPLFALLLMLIRCIRPALVGGLFAAEVMAVCAMRRGWAVATCCDLVRDCGKGIARLGKMFRVIEGSLHGALWNACFQQILGVIRLDSPLLCKVFAGTLVQDQVQCIIEAAETRSQRIFLLFLKNLLLGCS